MRDLRLPRILSLSSNTLPAAAIYQKSSARFHRRDSTLVFRTVNCRRNMATAEKNQPKEGKEVKEEKEEESQKKKKKKEWAIPPPPEQPEPGDCCGSGCVRCVWDVYYEELDAYNKLYKSSDSK